MREGTRASRLIVLAALCLTVVGFLVPWRKPGNPLGWCLTVMTVAGGFSQVGSLYAIADYRVRHGTLPFGWVAMLAQPGWAIAIVGIGVAVLIFPDGRPATPWLPHMLWLYLVPGVLRTALEPAHLTMWTAARD